MQPNEINEPLTADERNAMRSYLQRAEVRLSTLHRIATAFIGGAGMLVLLPVFFKEEIVVLIKLFLTHVPDFTGQLRGAPQGIATVGLYICLLYPFILSLAIPIYALYLMLKDVIHFYFTIYTPGFPANLTTPTFALSGIAFSPDESERVKQQILEYEYPHASSINFAIPFSPAKRKTYLDETIQRTNGDIIPKTRRWDTLETSLPSAVDRETADRFSAAFGLARTLDRQLAEEVATSEISLVRHILYLRRLVLRYIKTLLMFIWTTIITFVMLPFVQDDKLPVFLVLAIGYLIWSLLVMRIMQMPLGWIYRHMHGIPDENHIDEQLVILENQVKRFCQIAIVASTLGLLLSVVLYFG